MGQITDLLQQWHSGSQVALNRLTTLVYQDVHGIALRLLKDEHDAATLQPTALVNEVYLRIRSLREVDWESHTQFLAAIASLMRNILVDHARRRKASKRRPITLNLSLQPSRMLPSIDVITVNDAIDRLAVDHPRAAKVVELRFFGGFELPEIAEVLEVSLSTAERDWRFARAWLSNEFRAK